MLEWCRRFFAHAQNVYYRIAHDRGMQYATIGHDIVIVSLREGVWERD